MCAGVRAEDFRAHDVHLPLATSHDFQLASPISGVIGTVTPQLVDCWRNNMRCPKCGCQDDKVIDSRASREGATIRRRRECVSCGHRYTTREQIERGRLMVSKRDGRNEEFSKEKLVASIIKACQKRSVSPETVDILAEQITEDLANSFDGEVPYREIGERAAVLAQLLG